VRLGGHDVSKLSRRSIARSLGYLPQETASLYDFTVEEIVRMGRYPHTKGFGSLDKNDHRVIQQSLQLTEMEALAFRPLSRLSGGERKRAFLASVLAQKPQILLLDEPTGALDIHYQVQFFRLLHELARDGMSIAVATHEINLASLFSDTLFVLSKGKPVKSGPPGQVLTPSTVKAVYGESVFMGRHPRTDRPAVFPQITAENTGEE
jgi:iron complex transport system ATP-binding protein